MSDMSITVIYHGILLALKATAIVGACKDGTGNIFCLFYT
jgi:hypothetical protein